MGPLGLIMQTSNSYWWMMQVGESRMAYRRSNTLRCLARGGTGCGHTLESLTNERRRCKDRKVPISQAKGQSILYACSTLWGADENQSFLYF